MLILPEKRCTFAAFFKTKVTTDFKKKSYYFYNPVYQA